MDAEKLPAWKALVSPPLLRRVYKPLLLLVVEVHVTDGCSSPHCISYLSAAPFEKVHAFMMQVVTPASQDPVEG